MRVPRSRMLSNESWEIGDNVFLCFVSKIVIATENCRSKEWRNMKVPKDKQMKRLKGSLNWLKARCQRNLNIFIPSLDQQIITSALQMCWRGSLASRRINWVQLTKSKHKLACTWTPPSSKSSSKCGYIAMIKDLHSYENRYVGKKAKEFHEKLSYYRNNMSVVF